MAKIKGYYINLDRSIDRRDRIQRNIDEQGLTAFYKRYAAIDGAKCNPCGRDLNSGELGLWETWISLLEKETLANGYEYLHIMEDDCILSKEFKGFCEQLPDNSLGSDLIMTEMYANPNAYQYLIEEHQRLKKEKKIKIEHNNYTGCASSVLIHRSRIKTVLEQLKTAYQKAESVLPLDNQLRKLDQQGLLIVSRVAPFITSIVIDDIKKTTIQEHEDTRITDSQIFCALLRRKLSTLDSKETTKALLKVFIRIMASNPAAETEEVDDKIARSIVNVVEDQKLLLYKLQPRLRGEIGNKQ